MYIISVLTAESFSRTTLQEFKW